MELINNIEKNNNLEIENKQNNFLNRTLGMAVNLAVDLGIRALLPNFIEDQIIDVKDNLVKHGLRNGINKTINDTINIGKNVLGIFKGDFKNVGQIQKIFSSGGLADDMSGVLDMVLNNIEKKGALKSSVTDIIRNGKDIIIDSIEKNVQDNIAEQLNMEKNINESINIWENAYNKKDFNNMDKNYKNIKKELDKLIPIEETIKKARKIENLHNIIKNNGNNFNLPNDLIEISSKI